MTITKYSALGRLGESVAYMKERVSPLGLSAIAVRASDLDLIMTLAEWARDELRSSGPPDWDHLRAIMNDLTRSE